MAKFDYRTKPSSEWTYYLVDDLPTMGNIYRYDTPEQVIEKFLEIEAGKYPAIGSSINASQEIDHIHRRENGVSVLVTDSDRMSTPIWRDSKEIQDAIDMMISKLNVQYEYDSTLFGNCFPSVYVKLNRHSEPLTNDYFADKLLCPDRPGNYLTAISEVYVTGQGWIEIEPFLEQLQNSRPSRCGEKSKDFFVNRLSVKYINEKGYMGEADMTPREFKQVRDRTVRELSAEKLASDLDAFSFDYDTYEYQDQVSDREENIAAIKKDISAGSLHYYRTYLADVLSDGSGTEEQQREARALQARLTALTPKELRRESLSEKIRSAEKVVHDAKHQTTPERSRGEGR